MKKVTVFTLFIFGLNTKIVFAQGGFNVDVLPTNVGGRQEFKRLFEQELIYPENSLKKKIGGKVVINFVVMNDSIAANVKPVSSGVPDIDAEAMRLFKLYQWVPAVKKGKYVSATWSVTFEFKPGKYAKICRKRGFTKFEYTSKTDSSGTIYKNPEQFPAYQKGNYVLLDFIKENLEYPPQAKLANLQGTVVVCFVVEPSGLITNIGIVNSVGGGCDQEAIRVFRLLGKWNAAKNKNMIVRSQMTLPFVFQLDNQFKDNSLGEQQK